MKQTTAYGVRIHAASMKPVQDMVRIYRQAVTFLIKVCNEQWNDKGVKRLETPIKVQH